MQVIIQSRHPITPTLHQGMDRRVRFVLRRLSRRLPRADVQLSDLNGPRGGVDKCCKVELRTNGHGVVVASSVAQDWRTALDRALSRAARMLLRLRQRSGALRRQQPPESEP